MLVLLLKARKDKDVRKNNMSKYNLTDIFEQYKIGSGWTSDFDYDGMLKTGLGTSIDTPIEVLKKISDDFEDVNYHRENSHLQDAIDAIEIGDMKQAEGRLDDFHVEIRKTQEEQGMDIEPTVGQFMQNYIKEDLFSKDGDNEDNVDNIDKVASPSAKGKGYDSSVAAQSKESGDEMDQITQTTKPMYKENKVPSLEEVYNIDRKGNEKPDTDGSDASKYKKAARDMKEARVDRDVAERIEGMLNIPLKRKFLDAFMDLWQDLIEEDPFYAEDVINHLNNEMHKEIDGYQAMGDRLNSIPMEENGDVKDYAEEIKEDDKKKLMDAAAKMIKDRILKDIPMDIVVDFVKTHFDDIKGMDNSEIEDEFENFRSVNYDYIDEDLKEHFNRFK